MTTDPIPTEAEVARMREYLGPPIVRWDRSLSRSDQIRLLNLIEAAMVVLRNLVDNSSCQCDVDLDGLDHRPDCELQAAREFLAAWKGEAKP